MEKVETFAGGYNIVGCSDAMGLDVQVCCAETG
jgi:hypothetical protein